VSRLLLTPLALVLMTVPAACTWTRVGEIRHTTFLTRTRLSLSADGCGETAGREATVQSDSEQALAALERAVGSLPSATRESVLDRVLPATFADTYAAGGAGSERVGGAGGQAPPASDRN
jgi:hypothetical protein